MSYYPENPIENPTEIPNFWPTYSQRVRLELFLIFYECHRINSFSANIVIAPWASPLARYDLSPIRTFTYGTEEVFPMTLRLKLHIYYLLYLLSTINTRHLPLTVIYASCTHPRIFSTLGSQTTIFACYDVSRYFNIPRHPDALFGGPGSRY